MVNLWTCLAERAIRPREWSMGRTYTMTDFNKNETSGVAVS